MPQKAVRSQLALHKKTVALTYLVERCRSRRPPMWVMRISYAYQLCVLGMRV
jgi:hypothetical protein